MRRERVPDEDEYVISADEKTQRQTLGRHHKTVAPGSGRPGLVAFEYPRGGTLAYLAWDVHHANLFDRVEIDVAACSADWAHVSAQRWRAERTLQVLARGLGSPAMTLVLVTP